MTFNKEYKDFQAQSLVIRQKLAEAEELSREDINTVVNLTAFDFMDSSSLRASVLIFKELSEKRGGKKWELIKENYYYTFITRKQE